MGFFSDLFDVDTTREGIERNIRRNSIKMAEIILTAIHSFNNLPNEQKQSKLWVYQKALLSYMGCKEISDNTVSFKKRNFVIKEETDAFDLIYFLIKTKFEGSLQNMVGLMETTIIFSKVIVDIKELIPEDSIYHKTKHSVANFIQPQERSKLAISKVKTLSIVEKIIDSINSIEFDTLINENWLIGVNKDGNVSLCAYDFICEHDRTKLEYMIRLDDIDEMIDFKQLNLHTDEDTEYQYTKELAIAILDELNIQEKIV